MLERVWRKGTFPHSWGECKLVATMVNSIEVLQKLKTESPYDPAIVLLGVYPDKTLIQKIHEPLCSQQHYSQQPRQGNRLDVH